MVSYQLVRFYRHSRPSPAVAEAVAKEADVYAGAEAADYPDVMHRTRCVTRNLQGTLTTDSRTRTLRIQTDRFSR